MNRILLMFICPCLVLTACTGVSPEASNAVKRMSDKLAAAEAIRVTGTRQLQQAGESEKADSATFDCLLRRPNQLRVTSRTEEKGSTQFVYDGSTVSLSHSIPNVYAVHSLRAGSVEELADYLEQRFGFEPPLTDLFVKDPYSVLAEGANYGRILGEVEFEGELCDRVEFAFKGVKWKMLISKTTSLPKVFEIETTGPDGRQRFRATFDKWNLQPEVSRKMFAFKASRQAHKIGMIPLTPAGSNEPE